MLQKLLGGLAALALTLALTPATWAEDMATDPSADNPDAEVVIPTEPGEPGAVVVPDEEGVAEDVLEEDDAIQEDLLGEEEKGAVQEDALSEEEKAAIDQEVQEEVVPREETIVVTQPRGAAPLDNVLVEIGGGASTFTGELGDVTEGGAGWTGRVVIGARTMLGFELAYFGAANTIEGLDVGINDVGDLDSANTVISSAGEGLVRLNLLGARAPVKPFVAGGANYTRFDSDTLFDNAEALGFPLAAGVQFYPTDNFSIGARGDYRILTDLIDEEVPDGNQWGGMLTVGANF